MYKAASLQLTQTGNAFSVGIFTSVTKVFPATLSHTASVLSSLTDATLLLYESRASTGPLCGWYELIGAGPVRRSNESIFLEYNPAITKLSQDTTERADILHL